jgi:hypothetical protein
VANARGRAAAERPGLLARADALLADQERTLARMAETVNRL